MLASSLGVDWVTLDVPADPPYPSDTYREIYSVTGEFIDWVRPGWIEHRADTSSGSSMIRVRLDRDLGILRIDGNVARWRRSHNFALRKLWDVYQEVFNDLGRIYRIREGSGILRRVDVACHLVFASQADAYLWIRWAAGQKIVRKYPVLYDAGVAWKTERWYLKVYDKIQDLRRHGHVRLAESLIKHGYVLRLELTLRYKVLQEIELDQLHLWIDDRVYSEISDFITGKLGVARLLDTESGVGVEEMVEMSHRLYTAAEAWRHGYDYRRAVEDGRISRRTYYRLRKELLAYGIDISLPCNVTALPVKVRTVKLTIPTREQVLEMVA